MRKKGYSREVFWEIFIIMMIMVIKQEPAAPDCLADRTTFHLADVT